MHPLPADVHQLLRSRTAPAHARVDAIVGGGLPTRGDYAAYLRGMHHFLCSCMATMGDAHAALRARLAWLDDDLAVLRAQPVAAIATATPRPLGEAAQLGWEYVLAGSAVGARYLLRQAQALGYSADAGARFLSGHAQSTDWPGYLRRLAGSDLSSADVDVAGEAAEAAFAAAERGFRQARGEVPA